MVNEIFNFDGSITYIVRPEHHRFDCSTSNIANEDKSVDNDPNVSISGHYQEQKLSYG